jgi:hypothetical protein
MPIILALGRLRKKDGEFNTSLGNTVRPVSKKRKRKKEKKRKIETLLIY